MKNDLASDDVLAGFLLGQMEEGRTSAFLADFEKKVGALTAEQVNEAFRRHVDPKQLVIVTAGDFQKKANGPRTIVAVIGAAGVQGVLFPGGALFVTARRS